MFQSFSGKPNKHPLENKRLKPKESPEDAKEIRTAMRRMTRQSVAVDPTEDFRNSVGSFNTKFSLPSFVKGVEKLTAEQRNAMNKVGFGNLLLLPDQTLNKKLLTELFDHWSCDESTFMLRPGPVEISLMDVVLILGLPVVGEPVIFCEDEALSELEAEYGAVSGKRKIDVSFLKWRLDSLGDTVNDDFVRTFLLFTFGTLLFPSSTGKIDSRYASFLHNLDAVPNFSWGAAVLGDLVFWLNKIKESNVQSIGGCLIFLQIWSYEHIDIARPSLLDTYLKYPRFCRWENSRSHIRQQLSAKFKELEAHQIIQTLQPTPLELHIPIVKQLLEAEKDMKQAGVKEFFYDVAGERSVTDSKKHVEEVDDVLGIQAGEYVSGSDVEVNGNDVETVLLQEPVLMDSQNHNEELVSLKVIQGEEHVSDSGADVETALSQETSGPTSIKGGSLLKGEASKERFVELHKQINELRSENMLLRGQLEQMKGKCLSSEPNMELRIENVLLKEQLEQLKDKCSSLTSEVEDLRRENLNLGSAINLAGRLENIMLDFQWNPVG